MSFFFRRAQMQAAPPPPPPQPPAQQPIPFYYTGPPPPPPSAPPLTLDRLLRPAIAAYIAGKSNNSDDGQVAQKGSLVAVANSIRRCVSGMGPWDISDLTLGLYKIATRHMLEGASDTIDGSVVSDKQELEDILHWLDWAWASYLADEKSVVEYLKIKEDKLKKCVNRSSVSKPAYIIAVDDSRKSVVLSIRGTYAATDVLTDLQPHNEAFEGGYAHSGILSAARWVLENEHERLQILMCENPGYKLVLTGHSLGAGTACLLYFLLHESIVGIPNSMIECWGYGCPPCVDKHLSEHAPFIRNVVLQDDIVSRACISALEDLRSEILQTDWGHVLEDGGIAKRMHGLVQTTKSTLGDFEQSLGYERGTFVQHAKKIAYTALVESFKAGVYGPQQRTYVQGSSVYGQSFLSQPPPPPAGYYNNSQCFINERPPAAGCYNHSQGQYYSNAPPYQWDVQVARPPSLAGLLSNAIRSYLNSPEQPQEKTFSTVTSKGIDGGSKGIDGGSKGIDVGRLFVPGVLYHIKRSPLPNKANQIQDQLSKLVTETSKISLVKGNDKKKDNKGKVEPSTSVSVETQHCIIKGLNPESRFMKIVLSKTVLSDHSLGSYKDGINDAIRWVTEVSRS